VTQIAVAPSSCVVLSPHLDDAVFSAWHVLARERDVLVITVFAGIPDPGFVAALDRKHGAHESATWVQRRRSEDHDVLDAAGCRVVQLPLLDLLYRSRVVPQLWSQIEAAPSRLLSLAAAEPTMRTPPDVVVHAVTPYVDGSSMVYAPLGIGCHPDHQDVGRAALELLGRVRDVRWYADSPYYLTEGLPSAVSGQPNQAADSLVHQGLDLLRLSEASAHHVELTDQEFDRKALAMRGYRTEFAAVNEDFGGIAGDAALMRHELWWGAP
jgi:hypothetical protein